jgi:queuine tRNA-ribosyltransferase
MFFELIQTDSSTNARAGLIRTAHGTVETPIFMPVGTQGTVKTVSPHELKELGAQIILGNTYHLYLRPGDALIAEAGGLHRFMGWSGPILTDSGGFQVFSLSELRKINDDGVRFQSHLDGSFHTFTPEKAVDIQTNIGSDIQMVLDECSPYPCSPEDAEKACGRTVRWAERCLARFKEIQSDFQYPRHMFGIAQGGTHPEIRRACAERLTQMDFDGYAIGGLAVGEPKQTMKEMTGLCTGIFPPGKPRYLMGVGKPEDIVEAIGLGVDMFDCVIPTRNGRNGTVYTRSGRLVIKNKTFERDFQPIDDRCTCYTCRHFTRAYLRHLLRAGETLGLRLATIHNLHFFLSIVQAARRAVLELRFSEWKNAFFDVYYKDNSVSSTKTRRIQCS